MASVSTMLVSSSTQAAKASRAGGSRQLVSSPRLAQHAKTLHHSRAAMTDASRAFGASRRRRHGVCRAEKQIISAAAAASLIDLDDSTFSDKHTFASYANWLIPGQLLVGRYPFIDPSNCKTRIQGEDRLRTILEAGITDFCSLQAELPDQVDMPIGGLDGFMPYKATTDMLASSMSGPVPQEWQVGLRNPWLDNYLPDRKRPGAEQENKVEATYSRFPVTDLETPSQEVLDEVINHLSEKLSNGEKVYLHCWGGRGRAGTIGACYLVKAYGLSAEEALKRVQTAYDTRRDGERCSPETDEQRECVTAYAARVQQSA